MGVYSFHRFFNLGGCMAEHIRYQVCCCCKAVFSYVHQVHKQTKPNKQNNKRNQQNTQTKTKKMSQTSQIQSPSNLLESLKLLDGNGAIDKKRVMDRKGVQVQNKHLYYYIKWVKPLDMAGPLGGFTAECIQFQVCCCCKAVFIVASGGLLLFQLVLVCARLESAAPTATPDARRHAVEIVEPLPT